MKTIAAPQKIALLVMIFLTSHTLFAQQNEQPKQKHYRLNIVKNENGKEEKIDETFNTREEMLAYMKEHNIEAPAGDEAVLNGDGEKKVVIKEKTIKKNADKPVEKKKKIVITEKQEAGTNKTELNISTSDLTAEERIAVIQSLINISGNNVEIVKMKDGNNTMAEARAATPPTGIENMKSDENGNINDVKLYPNPSNGDFHVEFNIAKPANVKLRITDLQGKEVYADATNNYSGKFVKDISHSAFAKGTYLVNIESGTERKTTQVVMQ